MNYYKGLIIMLMLSMSSSHTYWGQSYVATVRRSLPVTGQQSLFATFSPAQNYVVIIVGLLGVSVALTYMVWKYKKKARKQEQKEQVQEIKAKIVQWINEKRAEQNNVNNSNVLCPS